LRWLNKLLGKESAAEGESDPVSVVVLLRRPISFSDQELLELADQTWGLNGPDGRVSPSLVGRTKSGKTGQARLLRVNMLHIAIITAAEPYFANRKTEVNSPRDVIEAAWNDQSAWMAIDYHRTKFDKPASRYTTYQVLLLFANKLWDDNCTGLYLPLEGVTMPRLGSLIESLKWWIRHEKRSPFPMVREFQQLTQSKVRRWRRARGD
jgi:hypothetical protein